MSMGVIVLVVVIAMLVMVMIVAVIMRRVIVRSMIVPGVVMPTIFHRMRVTAGIGAAFGIERRLDLDDARAEPRHHRLDNVIAPDPEALWHDLRRQMPVAEMPGDPDQMQRIGTPDLDQRLGCRNHLDQPAIFQHQRIAAA